MAMQENVSVGLRDRPPGHRRTVQDQGRHDRHRAHRNAPPPGANCFRRSGQSLAPRSRENPRDPVPTDGSKQWTLFIRRRLVLFLVTLVRFLVFTTTLNCPPGFKTTQLFDRFVILDVAWGDVGGMGRWARRADRWQVTTISPA